MGMDIIGSGDRMVALVEIEEGSEKKIEDVARELMAENKNVRSVLQKFPGTRGAYRTKTYKFVAGDRDTEVLHKEYGYLLKLDPQKVYFSPRESTVRQHVSSRVMPGDKVLVMFAGVGPYPVCMAKSQPKLSEIVAVEFNPEAFQYMMDNIRINRIAHLVTPVMGDVRIVCSSMSGQFDKIVMPMVEAFDFMDVAVDCCKSGGLIQIYMVSDKERLYEDCRAAIQEKLKSSGRGYEIEAESKVGLYSPGKWKVLIEIRMK
jgi:tRNA (guanine37-N1)-methyltransferase